MHMHRHERACRRPAEGSPQQQRKKHKANTPQQKTPTKAVKAKGTLKANKPKPRARASTKQGKKTAESSSEDLESESEEDEVDEGEQLLE